MAVIMPFKGIRYNVKHIKDLSRVVTPPYDVISPHAQENYHARHDHNVIRLILGKQYPKDNAGNNWYTRAAALYQEWQRNQVLIRDDAPGIYLYEMEYQWEDEGYRKRTGIIAAVKLEDLTSGTVRPHEKTFSATKDERFSLIKTCKANLSPIFSLFSDTKSYVLQRLSSYKELTPIVDFMDENGSYHRMWRVTDPAGIREIHVFFQDKELFIADGHHRYETALRYYKFLEENIDRSLASSAAAHVMMYLCPMEGGEITILPAHRLLKRLPASFDLESFLKEIRKYFDVQAFDFTRTHKKKARLDFINLLQEKGRRSNAFGFYPGGHNTYYIFSLKPGVLNGGELSDVHPELRKLDVVVLTQLIFQKIMGMKEKELDDEANLNYTSRFNPALDMVEMGRLDAAFLLNPTPIEQMRRVAGASLIMPRKSTYFYPKVITGLVFNNLDPEEQLTLP